MGLHQIICGFLLATLTVLFLVPSSQSIAVLSIDLGSEWMKIGIVSPGVPMEIVLNKESKRKTPAVLSFRGQDRMFGEDAVTAGARFPKHTYAYLLDLIGKKIDNPLVKQYQKRFPYYDIVEDPDRGTVLFKHDENTLYSPEELIGMLFHRAKEFAEISAGQGVNEVVLIVPGYFNQAERQAMLQAAELAGLKVLQLMNDYTAVALNYGIFRYKDFNESAQYVMFVDMGASSTTAAVVSYQVQKTKNLGIVESHPQASIVGVGYDRTLGGLEMQLRLRDFLGKKFNELKKTPNDVFKNPRALAKLFKEAGRVKNVLSANAEHYAQVEGLLDEIDMKILVTRDQFEELCKDLVDRIKSPIDQALKSSGLSMDTINQVVLVGAGTRMPKIQERLQSIVGMDLSKNLNTDEAAALGAVYKAADLSTGFKVKPFLTKDAVIFPIQVTFEREVDGQSTKQVKRVLFGPMNPYPQKKVMTFNKHTEDFSFNVHYGELNHIPANEIENLGSQELRTISLSGVTDAINKHKGPNSESKGIKAHFALDESGILNLAGVELLVEKNSTDEEESTFSKLGTTISQLFTGSDEAEKAEKPVREDAEAGGEEKKAEEAAQKAKESVKEDDKNSSGSKEGEKPGDNKEDNKKNDGALKEEKKSKIVIVKEKITADENIRCVSKLNDKQLGDALKKIQELNEYDNLRNRREKALNALESFVFDAQNKLDEEEYSAAVTSDESEKIRQACSELSDWLYEDGATADADAYESKLAELQKLTTALYSRVKEHRERPEAILGLRQLLNSSSLFLKEARNVSATKIESGDTSIFTEVELNTLETAIKETEEWLDKMLKAQSAQKLSETPKLTVRIISEKMGLLKREVKYLVSKAKIWKPKVKEEVVGDKNKTEEKVEPENADSGKSEESVDAEGTATNAEDTSTSEKESVDNTEEETVTETKDESPDSLHSEL